MSAYSNYDFDGTYEIIHSYKDRYPHTVCAVNTPTGAVFIDTTQETHWYGSREDLVTTKTSVFIPGVFWDAGEGCFVKIGAK